MFKVYDNIISWATRKQSTISLSSTESEYAALGEGICEAKWIQGLLVEVGYTRETPTTIYIDNQSTIKIAEEPRNHRKMKHVDVKYHFIRESIKNQEVNLEYKPTRDQTADIMTKALGRSCFEKHRINLSLS